VGRQQDEVVIYWRPDCVFCLDLLLRLRWTRLRYRKVDIRKDPGAKAFVRSVAGGNETVPTVVVAGRALKAHRNLDGGRPETSDGRGERAQCRRSARP
jgi:glutaredoxin